ncbi:threonylcarbamoyl-AMP synthase [Alphaproteobacteria bacterium 46_93_T64]|nr:threonylcarbamoyl-AMP synthase [Alphaproteobacteria bacterium 46_93_T64]
MSSNNNIKQPTAENLQTAASALKSSELVSFPTETVYGLGANALDDSAVAQIFEAKGRPSFNPLIVHLPDQEQAEEYVRFDDTANLLANHFWPGPLTLVLPRKPDCKISRLVSAGLETLAIRVPANKLARDLLKLCALPIAAPSANPSGQISPTNAQHVAAGLGDKVSIILDGGPCNIGVESTVVSVDGGVVTLLRPGGVTREQLESVVGNVSGAKADSAITSPGMLLSHYAPSCPVRLNATTHKDSEDYLGFGPGTEAFETKNLSPTSNLKEATANLFAFFHDLDRQGAAAIAVAPIPRTGLGVAINDRLQRAAAPRNNK